MEERQSNICRAKTGMLVLKDCGRPATGACSSCGRPVCGRHKCETAKGMCCPECAAMDTTAQQFDMDGKATAARPGAKKKPTRVKMPPPKTGAAEPEDYDDLTPASRARYRRMWFDPYPYYYSSPYFFYYSDYHSFDYRDSSWNPSSGHIRSTGSGGDDGYDPSES